MGPMGLAWAASIVAVVEVVVLFVIMSRRIKGLFDLVFVQHILKMVSATGFTALVTYFAVLLLPLNVADQSFMATFPKFALIILASLGSYIIFSKLLKIDEVNPILKRITSVLFGGAK